MIRHCLKRTKRAIHGSPRSRKTERGQGLVEYALGLVLVSMVATVSLALMGDAVKEVYCTAVQTLNPDLECTVLPGGPTILNAKYDSQSGELDLMAKAVEGCDVDLEVEGYGAMVRQGSSYVFKKSIPGSPPWTLQVGHDDCGWTEVTVTE